MSIYVICEESFDFGEESHAASISRDQAVEWVRNNKTTYEFCASCVIAGWNYSEEEGEKK